MEIKKFNLLDEPWIRVMKLDGTEDEVSLKEVFEQAPSIFRLVGETETQNAALTRLLEAILHRVLTTWDLDGEEAPLEDEPEGNERWKEIWENGEFPVSVILEYLESQREKFYLFHPEYPFYQSNLAKIGTFYGAGKLYGDMSESSNKIRLFQARSKAGKEECSYAEAARWLPALIGYDDTASKAKGKGANGDKLPSPGAGWLGKIGQIYLEGNNLFETLMLNTVLLDEALQEPDLPIWENERPAKEREEIAAPINISEILTIPSRWVYLQDNGRAVEGYNLLGGWFFDSKSNPLEPYTIWRNTAKKPGKKAVSQEVKPEFSPARHDPSRQLWRNFANYMPLKYDASEMTPMVIQWFAKITRIIGKDYPVTLRAVSAQYGDKDFFITDLTGDSLMMSSSLFDSEESSLYLRKAIEEQIEKCSKLADAVALLACDLAEAEGKDSAHPDIKPRMKNAKAILYNALTEPFSAWLSSLKVQEGSFYSDELDEWEQTARQVGNQTAAQLLKRSAQRAAFGTKVETSGGASAAKNIYTAEKGYRYRVGKIYKRQNDESERKEE